MTPLRRFTLVAAGIALCSTTYLAGRHTAYAQTQLELNEQANHDFQKADKKLNIAYQQLLKKYSDKDSAVTKGKIVAAERAWVKYRDLQGDMEASIGGEGGSIYPALYASTLQDVTEERTKRINKLIHENDGR